MSYSTGDLDLKTQIRIESEKNVTVEFVVNEANAMWKECKSRNIKYGDIERSDKLMAEMQKTHPEFSKSYPIVLRYMCQMQEYNSKAFKMWLDKIKVRPWKTEGEYLDAQADYVTMLYRAIKPRSPQKDINTLRTNIRNMLQREHDTFKKYVNEYDAEVSAEEKLLREKNKQEFIDYIKSMDAANFNPEALRVESSEASVPIIDVDKLAESIQSTPAHIDFDVKSDDLLS